jgi:hypothetical protein
MFTTTPAITISPEGVEGSPAGTIPNTYCVIQTASSAQFTFCCIGHDADFVHYVAIQD